ncbi:hypothetical protein [Streptomyces sp. YS-3]|uniref:hypothetical protein n=1 Tax=Streptomyces sp. YS-3 TaxID=3381352 RepID=UPI003862C134
MNTATHPADPGTWVRGITIRQPWTTCILAGKDVENRPAPWSWRSLVLLHAGAATERAPMRDPLVATAIRDRALHTRAVIGVARLTGCHQDAVGAAPSSRWAQPDAFHLVLTDVQELALPIPWLKLGPWRPTQDLVNQLLLQLPHLAPEGTS